MVRFDDEKYKDEESMYTIVEGKIILLRLGQLENVYETRRSTPSSKITSSREVQSTNVYESICLMFEGIVIVFSDVHELKSPLLSSVKDDDKVTDSREEQYLKTSLPIVRRLFGMINSFNDEQFSNALVSMLSKDDVLENVTVSRPVHSQNAPCSISVTWLGI